MLDLRPKGCGSMLSLCPRARSHHSIVGHNRYASETPLKWRFAGGPMLARFSWYLFPLSQPKKILSVLQSWTFNTLNIVSCFSIKTIKTSVL